jgi:heptosyltransferase-3
VRRIVVVEMTRLGDLVEASALLEPLRRAYPAAALEVVGAEAYAVLFGGGRVLYHGLPSRGAAFVRGLFALRRRLQGPDLLVVVASPAVRNSLVLLASGPGRACGYLFSEAGSLGYDIPAPLRALGGGWDGRLLKAQGVHLVERAGLALRVAGIPEEGLNPDLGRRSARDPAGVVIHTGSNGTLRRWPMDRFVLLAAGLAAEGWKVTLIPAESGAAGEVPPGVRVEALPNLEDLRDALAGAALFIGNDSGPMHLAAALGTPCLGLFGPTSTRGSGPWPLPGPGSPHRALWSEVPCSPCAQLFCVQPEAWCMGQLGVERVLLQALDMLQGGRLGAQPGKGGPQA